MFSLWIIFLFGFEFSEAGVPVRISGPKPSGYLPFHPELLQPAIVPPLDLLRDPDTAYAENHGIKGFRKSLQVERIVEHPFVVLMPNPSPEKKYSAYLLTNGIRTTYENRPFLENLLRNDLSETAVVFDPTVRRRLSFFPVSNFTVIPRFFPGAVTHSVSVPWMTFGNVTVTGRNRLGEKRVGGRLYNFVVFGDEDWDFFPENSVFDWTRPFPFAFAPPPPLAEKETSPKPPATESASEVPESSSTEPNPETESVENKEADPKMR